MEEASTASGAGITLTAGSNLASAAIRANSSLDCAPQAIHGALSKAQQRVHNQADCTA
jgi:hypothetical protein